MDSVKFIKTGCRLASPDADKFLYPGDPGYEDAGYEIEFAVGPEWELRLISDEIDRVNGKNPR